MTNDDKSRQTYLTEQQQVVGRVVSADRSRDHSRHNGQETCHEAAYPGSDAPRHESLHHDLPRQRARQCRVLTRRQQRQSEQNRRGSRVQQRLQQLVRGLQCRDRGVVVGVKRRRRNDQNRCVHEERHGQTQRGIQRRIIDGFFDALFSATKRSMLNKIQNETRQ